MNINKILSQIKKQKSGYLFILPQLILFVLFMLYPAFQGIKMSFYNIDLTKTSWAGIQNYITLFSDDIFLKSVKNTLIFVLAITFLTVVIGLFIATSIYDKHPSYIAFIRGSYYIPVIVSAVVLSIIWSWLLSPGNGLINYLLEKFGYEVINFLGDRRYVLPILVFISFTTNLGIAVVMFISAILGIPDSFLEAAEIDGASEWQKIKHIILPLINPTIIYVMIITTISAVKVFAVVQILTSGGPNYASITMMYLLYERAFIYNDMGIASAIGTIMFIIVLILSMIQFKIFKKNLT